MKLRWVIALYGAALLWPTALQGQVVKLPTKVEGQPGDFIEVKSEADGKEVRWYAPDAGLKLFPVHLLKDTKTAVVIATKPGSYRLVAWTAKGDIPSAEAVCIVVVGGAPVPPDPPPVNDPLLEPVQAAYNADPSATKVEDKVALAAIYRATIPALTDVGTAEMLFKLIKGATELRIEGRLKPIRSLFGAELEKVLPTDPIAVLTTTQKAEAARQLNRFAAVLEGVK